MSDYDKISGSIQKIEMTEEEAEKICNDRGITKYGDTWVETLGAETDDYCFVKGFGLFKILEFNKEGPYLAWFKTKTENGVINFDAYYYNGGCHWTELLEDWLKKNGY